MTRFDQLLSLQIAAVLAGCSGSGGSDDTKTTPYDSTTPTGTVSTDTDVDTDTDTDADTDTDTDADTDTDTDTDTAVPDGECAKLYPDTSGIPTGYPYYGGSGTSSTYYWYDRGYVAVPAGEPCPEPEEIGTLGHTNCCPTPSYYATCGFTHKDVDQLPDYYGGWYPAPGGTGSTYNGSQLYDVCWYESVWGPATDTSCCGRPLLCDDHAVVAEVSHRTDWADRAPAASPATDLDRRRQAGAYWLRAAQLEHASVASFARFTLELLRYGAPPELVDGSLQAGRDEVEHARLCYALAGSLLGTSVGPAPMPLDRAADLAPSLEAFAEALLLEGCIGETLAVLDAAARLAVTSDPAVCDALQTILDDEARHASLAWRAMAWVLSRDYDGRVRAHLDRVLADARPEAAPASELHGLGLVPSDRRDAAFDRGFDEVITPMWRALAA